MAIPGGGAYPARGVGHRPSPWINQMNKVLGSVQLNQLDIFQQAFKRALDSHRPLAHLREDLEPAADVAAAYVIQY